MVRPWDAIAYLLRYAAPQLAANFKTEAESLLPYVALGALRQQEYAGWNNPFADRSEDPPLVIDVGAFTGEFSAEVFRLMRRRGTADGTKRRDVRVFAVEPAPPAFEKLSARADEERWTNFCALQVAISSRVATDVPMRVNSWFAMGAHLAQPDEELEDNCQEVLVQQTTLDMLLEEGHCGLTPSAQIYLLKVDCEGHDAFVLEGARRLLDSGSVKFLLFEHAVHNDAPDLEVVLTALWRQDYGCFLVLDRLLVPISDLWWHPAYRDRRHGGVVFNVDIFCANPHDADLRVLIEGFATHTHAKRASDLALQAVKGWRAAKPRGRGPSVADLYDIPYLEAKPSTDPSLKAFLIGDLLRHGYGAAPTLRERREAMVWFRQAVRAGRGMGAVGSREFADAAVLELAGCYHFGDCARVDLDAANYWYAGVQEPHWAVFLAELATLHLGNVTSTAVEVTEQPQQ